MRIALTGDPLYTNAGELVAAAAALRRGDTAPLTRLADSANWALNRTRATRPSTRPYDAAAQCTDFGFVWTPCSLPVREAQYERALADCRSVRSRPRVGGNGEVFPATA